MSARPDTSLTRRLDGGGVVALDGGLSNALEDAGAGLYSALWTARLLVDEPARGAGGLEGELRAVGEGATRG